MHASRQACQTPRHRFHIFVFTNVLKDYIRSALELLDLPPSCVSTLDAWCCEYYENSIRHHLPWDPVRNTRDFPTIRSYADGRGRRAARRETRRHGLRSAGRGRSRRTH